MTKGAGRGALFGAAAGLFAAVVTKVAYGHDLDFAEATRAGLTGGVIAGGINGAGQSIQAAINAAAAGGIIRIEPGTHSEALTVDKPGLRIVGLGGDDKPGVVIKNPGGADDGITVSQSAAGFTLENGVVLTGVDRFLLSRITAISNGEYGLFPVFSSHVVIERSTATGHTDAGIYVGQSSNIEVRHSTAYGNVLGIEIENSTRVSVLDNESHDNVVGVMVVLLPGLTVKTSDGVRVLHNWVGDPGGGRRPRRHRRQRGDRQSVRRRRTRELTHPGGARGASAGGLR